MNMGRLGKRMGFRNKKWPLTVAFTQSRVIYAHPEALTSFLILSFIDLSVAFSHSWKHTLFLLLWELPWFSLLLQTDACFWLPLSQIAWSIEHQLVFAVLFFQYISAVIGKRTRWWNKFVLCFLCSTHEQGVILIVEHRSCLVFIGL